MATANPVASIIVGMLAAMLLLDKVICNLIVTYMANAKCKSTSQLTSYEQVSKQHDTQCGYHRGGSRNFGKGAYPPCERHANAED